MCLIQLLKEKKNNYEKVNSAKDLNEIFQKTDVVIISNDNKYFSKLDLNKLSKKMNSNALIYDVWNLYNKKELKLNNNVDYFSLGNQRIS